MNSLAKFKPYQDDLHKMLFADDIEIQNIKSDETKGKILPSIPGEYEYVKLNDIHYDMPFLLSRLIDNLKMIHKHKTVPPIMLNKNEDGTIHSVTDGRHRIYVCKLFDYTEILALITPIYTSDESDNED